MERYVLKNRIAKPWEKFDGKLSPNLAGYDSWESAFRAYREFRICLGNNN